MARSSERVRPATTDDSLDVRRILDAAVLEFAALEPRIDADDVLVATTDAGTVRGVIVLEPAASAAVTEGIEPSPERTGSERLDDRGAHIDAIAVRNSHRSRGIGTALVEAALEREGRLTAHFDVGVRPFYEGLGFDIVALDSDRYAGVRERRE
ncbi:GNAT family N-acetyltransferase [Halovivax cerinus]|uniref:GNAT family N-acetyltransferase n=1 Tax=Halovivax cerinus TaxID=1487865 RepID=A0ABD5NSG7_9EURY|nr:GNAT family N-acetyltransferase [Halovivax cerinus]